MTNPNLAEVINTLKTVFPDGEHLGKIKAQRKLNTPAVLTALTLSDADNDEWHECQSHGNYGKNFASGGNWSVTNKSTNPPEGIKNLIKTL